MKLTFKILILNLILILAGNASFATRIGFFTKASPYIINLRPQSLMHASLHNLNNLKDKSKFLPITCMKCNNPRIADLSSKGMKELAKTCTEFVKEECELGQSFEEALKGTLKSGSILKDKLTETEQGIVYEVVSVVPEETLKNFFPYLKANAVVEGATKYTVPADTPEGYYVGIGLNSKLTKKILFSFFLPKKASNEIDNMIDKGEDEQVISEKIAENSELSNAYPVE